MAVESLNRSSEMAPDTVEMPAPTPWPIVLAFGITLLFAGLVTSAAVSVLGAALAIAGAVGWFRDVLPHEAHETVPVVRQVPAVTTARHEVARMEIAPELQRAWLPLEIYPISAGIKGGLAGSVAMALAGDALRHFQPAPASGIRSIFWLPVFSQPPGPRPRRKSPHFTGCTFSSPFRFT